MISADHQLPALVCPWCGLAVDTASGVGHGEAPQPGNYAVCISCAQPMVFGADLTLQRMRGSEISALPQGQQDDLHLMMRAVRSIDRREVP